MLLRIADKFKRVYKRSEIYVGTTKLMVSERARERIIDIKKPSKKKTLPIKEFAHVVIIFV